MHADSIVFEADYEGTASLRRWQLAVLGEYDGTGWIPSGRFTTIGPRLLQPRGVPAVGELTQRIWVRELRSLWLPAVDRPVAASIGSRDIRAKVDPETGILAAAEVRDSVLDGIRYTVHSFVSPDVSPADADQRGATTAVRATDAIPAAVLREMEKFQVQNLRTPGSDDLAFARALEAHVHSYSVSSDGTGGSSIGALAEVQKTKSGASRPDGLIVCGARTRRGYVGPCRGRVRAAVLSPSPDTSL